MKLLSWNLRGLGNPRGFISLHEQIAKEDPDLVFLRETKVTSNYFTSKKFSLGFDNAFVVDCVWRSGVLAILWKKDIDFTLLQFSNHHIHGVISVGMNGSHAMIYGKLLGSMDNQSPLGEASYGTS